MNGRTGNNPFSIITADSSGIIINSSMSSSPGSSSQCSPLGGDGSESPSGLLMNAVMMMNAAAGGAPSPGMGTTAKSVGSLSRVQSQSSPLAAKSPVMSPSAPASSSKKSPLSAGGGDESRQKTDLFLSQFQAQMSQMKEAMDELLQKSGSSSPSPRANSPSGGGRSRAGGAGGKKSGQTVPAAAAVAVAVATVGGGGGGPGQQGGSGGGVTYQSRISTTNGLKLKIKKSQKMYKKRGPKAGGKRGRRKRKKGADDEDDYDISDLSDDFGDHVPRLSKVARSSTSSFHDEDEVSSHNIPSGWGDRLPESVLERIFSHGVQDSVGGCIPFLVRVGKVSRLWRKVASNPKMWTDVDLSNPRVKHVYRTERNLVYFMEHRFFHATHLNLGGWSSALTNVAVDVLVRCCKELESLEVASCQKLSGPNLKRITEQCNCLKKLDLSAISPTYNSKSAVTPTAVTEATEAMGSRLTYLSLANNCLANCSQIVSALADHCPSLAVLDLSNVTSPRRDTIQINVEHLQQGCSLVRILRLTNSDIALEHTTLKEQVSSPGFPNLEELSIAVDPKKCSGMDDGDLERFVKNAKKLRLLDVRGCGKIGDSGLVRVPAWDLEHLYLSGCYATKSSNDGLELIVRKWRHSFKEIDFSWTPNEDAINLAIRALSEVDPGDELPPVKVIDLCGSSVSLDSIKKALKVCVYLTRLNLTSCRALPRGMKRNYAHVEDVVVLREQVLSGKFDDNPNNH